VRDPFDMVAWNAFAAAAPALAEAGRRLIYRTETGEVLLASVRGDEPPRIHPIYVALHDGRLYAFLSRSAKATDLVTDGRYALHTHQDPAAPSEFMVRGRVRVVGDAAEREAIAAGWYFETDDTWILVEFSIESAVLGERASPDEWPPRYASWHSEAVAAVER
jgi:nitroimidazol reductase NimA-like FMN-containing flavoprotein (pyridoxamine 5'-phosphate oxidase superfamily)